LLLLFQGKRYKKTSSAMQCFALFPFGFRKLKGFRGRSVLGKHCTDESINAIISLINVADKVWVPNKYYHVPNGWVKAIAASVRFCD